MSGQLRKMQDRNEAAVSFGTGANRLLVVAWGPDIGVWDYVGPRAAVEMGVQPALVDPRNLRPQRLNHNLSFRVPGKPRPEGGFVYGDPAVSLALYRARLAGARQPTALVWACWRELLGKVPRWARTFLLSRTAPPSATAIDDSGAAVECVSAAEAEKVRSALRAQQELNELGRLTATAPKLGDLMAAEPEPRVAPQRFSPDERVSAAQFLYWTGPDGRRLLIENRLGWLSLARALAQVGRARALREAHRGLRAVLKAAFPRAYAVHRNRVAAILQTRPMTPSRLLFWMLAWGRLPTHDVPGSVASAVIGLSEATRDRRRGAWYKQPVPVLTRLARVVLNWQRMGAPRDPRIGPERDAPPDMTTGVTSSLIQDAVHMAWALDGLAELSRIESPARFLDYHRRCGAELGRRLSAELSPTLRFPEPSAPLGRIAGEHGPLTIEWLFCPELLTVEGNRMRHCVGGYANRAASGAWAFYHLTLGDEMATMQVRQHAQTPQQRRPRIEIAQLRGGLNADPSPALVRALWAVFEAVGAYAEIPHDCMALVAEGAVDLWEHLPLGSGSGLLYGLFPAGAVPQPWVGQGHAGAPGRWSRPHPQLYRMSTELLAPDKRRRFTTAELTELVYTPEPDLCAVKWAPVPNAQILDARAVAHLLEAP